MIDAQTIPDPSLPPADGYYLQRARARLDTLGIRTPEAFAQRYGVALDTLTVDEALRLLVLPDHPRDRDRATWTLIQRRTYTIGLIAALGVLRSRLENGRAVLDGRYTLRAEVRWFRLATRAVRLIAKMARADRAAEVAFLGSDLGRWYVTLDWPAPSTAAKAVDW